MASIFERDQSTIGTVIGIAVCVIAVLGGQFLGWEWGSGQAIPFVVGIIAVVLAGWLTYQRYRS